MSRKNKTYNYNPYGKEDQQKEEVQYVKPKTDGQEDLIAAISENSIVMICGPAGSGKAQPLYSKILTPTGWKTMGEIKLGDKVCSVDGEDSEVISISERTLQEVYRVFFKDGSFTDCSINHLWDIYLSNKDSSLCGWNTLELKDFKDKLQMKTYKGRFGTPIAKNINFESEKELKLDPYILGVLLGDGGLTQRPNFTVNDQEIANKVDKLIRKYDCQVIKVKSKYGYSIKRIQGTKNTNNVLESLKDFNLIGKLSCEKSIPEEYLFSNREDRLSLICGLMDTDGTVSKTGHVSYCTTSPVLAQQMKFLLNSIGALTYTSIKKPWYYDKNGNKKYCRDAYNISVRYENSKELFRLTRKKKLVNESYQYKDRLYRRIDRVEYLGQDICQCIAVSHKSQLYVTDDFIVTHNTYVTTAMACQYLAQQKVKKIIVTRPIVATSSKALGALPGELREKFDPYLVPVLEIMKKYYSHTEVERFVRDKTIETVPLELMRGRTFDDSFILVDEAENCYFEQLLMVLTRIGQNSKLVINGDIEQTDLKYEAGGFEKIMNMLEGIPDIEIVEMLEEDITRNKLIKDILRAVATRKV